MIAVRCIALLATIIALAVSTAAASDELDRAKDLYRSASYDEALIVLERVAGESSGAVRAEANEFRLFCLIALDRKVDARVTIETMVNADPFYKLTTDQASPRVRTMFKDVRQSLLPGLVQREYTAARDAFDRQEPEAAERFERVLTLLDDPLLTPTPALTDLRTVAAGFRDLSQARVKKVEPPPPAPAPAVAQQPVVANNAPTSTGSEASRTVAAPPARSGPPVYREGDANVVPPVVLKQTAPQWVVPQGTRPGAWQPEAVLELTIDESGNVSNVVLRKGFHPSYDPQLVKAAEGWKYEPARKDGVPVRFVKFVAIRLGGVN
jgi:TonB family protein